MNRIQLAAGAAFVLSVLAPLAAHGAEWVGPDWAGQEPKFPPGSLYWDTNQYKVCPVLFRAVLTVENQPLAHAGGALRAWWRIATW